MRKFTFVTILLSVFLTGFSQQTLRRRELIADTLMLKMLPTDPSVPPSGYGFIYGKSDSVWFRADDGSVYLVSPQVASSYVNYFTLTADSTIAPKYTLDLSSLRLPVDSRTVIANAPIVYAPYGDTVDIKLMIDGHRALTIWGISDGAGSYSKLGVHASGLFTADSTSGIGGGEVDTTATPTANYVAKFTAANKIGNSLIRDDGTNVAIGTTPGTYKFQVAGTGYFSDDITMEDDAYLKFLNSSGSVLMQIYTSSTNIIRLNSPNGIAFKYTGVADEDWGYFSSSEQKFYSSGVERFVVNSTGIAMKGRQVITPISSDDVYFYLAEKTTDPGFTDAGYGTLYGKAKKIYYQNSDGTVYDLTAGGGGAGTVTSVASGNGMNFTTITTTGTVTLGTPSSVTSTSTNSVTTTSHTHELGTVAVADGGTGLTSVAAGSVIAANSANTFTAITSTSEVLPLYNDNGTVSWYASGIQYVKLSLTASQIDNLNATPQTLIGAPGAGKVIILDMEQSFCQYNHVTTAYASNPAVQLYIASTLVPVGTLGINLDLALTQTSRINDANNGACLAANTGLKIRTTFDTSTGDGTIDLYLAYRIVTL